ncbi:MAG: CBS domain-containing protein [Candidatus Nanohaloarchaea archaeon]
MEFFEFEKVAEMLRKKRRRLGVKQKKAADLAGLSPSQVNRMEKNSVNPSYGSVYRLYTALEALESEEAETASDLMNGEVTWISGGETLEEAARKMRENDFSQLPVKVEGENAGRITEKMIIGAGDPDLEVGEVMGSELMKVGGDARVELVEEILRQEPAVLVEGESGYQGIITKADLL